MAYTELHTKTWTCDECGKTEQDRQEFPRKSYATYDGAHQYGDPLSGWLKLMRWYGSQTSDYDFCSIACLQTWLSKDPRYYLGA